MNEALIVDHFTHLYIYLVLVLGACRRRQVQPVSLALRLAPTPRLHAIAGMSQASIQSREMTAKVSLIKP
jgi:hypothetical protein